MVYGSCRCIMVLEYGDDGMSWADEPCPICEGPLEEVYYGGGVTKWECNRCAKNFITSITSEYDD